MTKTFKTIADLLLILEDQAPDFPVGVLFKDSIASLIQFARERGLSEKEMKTMLQNAADKVGNSEEKEIDEEVVEYSQTLKPMNT